MSGPRADVETSPATPAMNCTEWCAHAVLMRLANETEGEAAGRTLGCADCPQWVNQTLKEVVNGTGNVTNVNKFYFYETETLTFLWILFILIMLGNSTVVIALITSKARKSRTNFFILHLAFADLSVGLISVLTDIFWKITVTWNAGNVACKIIKFLQILVTYSSTYVLVALSIDRCDAITHPMNFTGSWRRAKLLIASAWSLSALFSLPYLHLYKEMLIEGTLECWIDLQTPQIWQLYISLAATSLFILPAVIIAACYIVIVVTIWRKGQELGNAAEKSKLAAGQRSCEPDQNTKRASSRGIIPKAKIKTVKMTFVIVSVFILCWSPYFIFNFLHVFKLLPETQTMVALSTFVQSLAPLNSAANPIIYCIFSGCDVCRGLRPRRQLSATPLEDKGPSPPLEAPPALPLDDSTEKPAGGSPKPARFRCCDLLCRRLFPCCRCAQASTDGSLTRIGTQYTFMSAESKRATMSHGSRPASLAHAGRNGSLDTARRPAGPRASLNQQRSLSRDSAVVRRDI